MKTLQIKILTVLLAFAIIGGCASTEQYPLVTAGGGRIYIQLNATSKNMSVGSDELLVYSADKTLAAFALFNAGVNEIYLFDVKTNKALRLWRTLLPVGLSVSSDNQRLMVLYAMEQNSIHQKMEIYDIKAQKTLAAINSGNYYYWYDAKTILYSKIRQVQVLNNEQAELPELVLQDVSGGAGEIRPYRKAELLNWYLPVYSDEKRYFYVRVTYPETVYQSLKQQKISAAAMLEKLQKQKTVSYFELSGSTERQITLDELKKLSDGKVNLDFLR